MEGASSSSSTADAIAFVPKRRSRSWLAVGLVLISACFGFLTIESHSSEAFASGAGLTVLKKTPGKKPYWTRYKSPRSTKSKLKVVLLKDQLKPFLGFKGWTKWVSRGHYRLVLFPRGIAVTVDNEVERKLAQEKRAATAEAERRTAVYQQEKQKLESSGPYKFEKKQRPGSDLIYGSLTTTEVAETLVRVAGVPVRVTAVTMPAEKVQTLGKYTVTVDLGEGISAFVQLEVVPEGGGSAGGDEDAEEKAE
eukprot:TRINITY_DN22731_c0_g1_i1.p1 TRINITY_DN22731_c0_g1~~TRINITY_DN22731_c0_g1_i1.p1  ORF type:complete len:251 (-),score=55.73 TRINITY_DN22731_c0_g1_i1:202-954(-)